VSGQYQLTLTKEERDMLIQCIDATIRSAQSAVVAASQLLPLAAKLQMAEEVKEPCDDTSAT
jgi:hypothetical protein